MNDVDKFVANKHPIQPMNETAQRFVADMERSGVKILRRAEVPLMGATVDAEGEGRLTPWQGGDCGVVGNVGDSGAIGEGV